MEFSGKEEDDDGRTGIGGRQAQAARTNNEIIRKQEKKDVCLAGR